MERERGAVAVLATVLSTNWTEIISRRMSFNTSLSTFNSALSHF